jgi:protein-S-isoprenylcysteine O-methyltransferase Ste14
LITVAAVGRGAGPVVALLAAKAPGSLLYEMALDAHALGWTSCMEYSSGLLGYSSLATGFKFHPKAEARELVTGGTYARTQNPIYLFGGLNTLGLVLYLAKPI